MGPYRFLVFRQSLVPFAADRWCVCIVALFSIPALPVQYQRWFSKDGQGRSALDVGPLPIVGSSQTAAAVSLAIALLTVSSRHTIADDTSGDALQQRLEAAGHRLVDRHWWVTTATASGPR